MLRIKEIRKQKRITAKELAEYVNVAESTMSLYENGKREPDFSTLLKISEFLETSIDYLLGNTETEKPAGEGELEDNVILMHRDGKVIRKEFSKEQMDMLFKMIDAVPEKPKDI